MTTIHEWAPFADHTPGKGSADSLESIHDNIHVLVGGNGQMSDPSVAGE
jgi:tyrosinase